MKDDRGWIKHAAGRAQRFLFPCILFIYPLLAANQGIDISDPMYSLTNFRFFPELEGTWALATYLANAVGFLLMKLPFGGTLLGINIYTRLLISAMALLAYFFLKGKMPAWIVFVGEMIAISYCWCPTTILYNYLTYFFFLAGCILLYRGLIWGRRNLLIWAGVCLGLNVMVRTPNILEALLILAVFYYGRMNGEEWAKIWKNVGWCVLGFAIGFLGIFCLICIQYGPGAYFGMFTSLSGYSATDDSYSPLSMITSVLGAYGRTLPWIMVILVCTLAGWLVFRALPKRLIWPARVGYGLCVLILVRLFWGRGVFTFTYYNYRSIYEWGMFLLYLALLSCILVMGNARYFKRDRLLALIVLLSMTVTPIGSNNDTMPNLNNLFLAAPFAIWGIWRALAPRIGRASAFPAAAMTVMIVGMAFIQGVGFHVSFAFGDGIYGEKRDAKVENSAILKGMKTREDNAENLTGLLGYMEGKSKEALVTFGNAPGLNYLLDMPPGISHAWPDLDTYPAEQMREELTALMESDQPLPAVILYKENGQMPEKGEKWRILQEYLTAGEYALLYENDGFIVYGTAGAAE